MRHAHLGERDRLVLLVDDVVAGLLELRPLLGLLVAGDARPRLELRDDLVDPVVLVGRLLGGAADDEGGPRLVDEDRVHLVHHREVVAPLDVHAEVELHVVAQVVEAELVVRPVGDVRPVGLLALPVVHAVLDDAHGEAQEAVEPAHPLGVALGQVVVDGDHVDALAGERVQVGGQGGDEGLALARLHLRDHPAVQDHAADELDVEVAHVEDAPAALAHDREGLGQQVVEARALREPLAELDRLGREGVVGQLAQRRLERADLGDHGADALQLPLVLGADDAGEDGVDHVRRWLPGGRERRSVPAAFQDGRDGRPAPVIQREYQPLPWIATGAGEDTRACGRRLEPSGAHGLHGLKRALGGPSEASGSATRPPSNGLRAQPDSLGRSERGSRGVRRSTPLLTQSCGTRR